MAAIHGLGLRGIEKKLALPYGPIGAPGVTRETLVHLPTSLEAATEQFMRKDSIAREVFGDYFVDHYGGTRQHELELFRKAVTDWESEFGTGLADGSAAIHGACLGRVREVCYLDWIAGMVVWVCSGLNEWSCERSRRTVLVILTSYNRRYINMTSESAGALRMVRRSITLELDGLYSEWGVPLSCSYALTQV